LISNLLLELSSLVLCICSLVLNIVLSDLVTPVWPESLRGSTIAKATINGEGVIDTIEQKVSPCAYSGARQQAGEQRHKEVW
jgi:hypothetical protein